jgi:hypothetical protein
MYRDIRYIYIAGNRCVKAGRFSTVYSLFPFGKLNWHAGKGR